MALAWDAVKSTLTPAVTLVGGFENPDGTCRGRPVDAVPGPDGALYLSDDSAGAICRLAAAGYTVTCPAACGPRAVRHPRSHAASR